MLLIQASHFPGISVLGEDLVTCALKKLLASKGLGSLSNIQKGTLNENSIKIYSSLVWVSSASESGEGEANLILLFCGKLLAPE